MFFLVVKYPSHLKIKYKRMCSLIFSNSAGTDGFCLIWHWEILGWVYQRRIRGSEPFLPQRIPAIDSAHIKPHWSDHTRRKEEEEKFAQKRLNNKRKLLFLPSYNLGKILKEKQKGKLLFYFFPFIFLWKKHWKKHTKNQNIKEPGVH